MSRTLCRIRREEGVNLRIHLTLRSDSSPEQAGAYVRKLQEVLRRVGASDGNMDEVRASQIGLVPFCEPPDRLTLVRVRASLRSRTTGVFPLRRQRVGQQDRRGIWYALRDQESEQRALHHERHL